MPIYKMEGKKDGQQKYRVRINYVDRNGNNRQIDRVVYGNAQAKALEAKLQREHKDAAQSVQRMTVHALYTEYMEVKRHEVRETTLDKSRRNLEHHVIPQLGDIRIDRLTMPVLQHWKLSISGLGLAIKTRRNIYGEFRALLNYAVKMDYLPKNPLHSVGNFKDAYTDACRETLQYYTPDEFKRYIACARECAAAANTINDWGYYVFFCIAFYAGLRKGEINALKWSDIDGNLLHVRRSIAQKLRGEDRETPPKNKSSYRTLQMPTPLIHILDEHKQRQAALRGFNDDWRVCGGIACLRDTSLSNKNKKFAQAAGLPCIRIHDFRHSHASLLANEGINIQEIARRLGHSKIEITWNTYAHLYPREEERAVQILDKIV